MIEVKNKGDLEQLEEPHDDKRVWWQLGVSGPGVEKLLREVESHDATTKTSQEQRKLGKKVRDLVKRPKQDGRFGKHVRRKTGDTQFALRREHNGEVSLTIMGWALCGPPFYFADGLSKRFPDLDVSFSVTDESDIRLWTVRSGMWRRHNMLDEIVKRRLPESTRKRINVVDRHVEVEKVSADVNAGRITLHEAGAMIAGRFGVDPATNVIATPVYSIWLAIEDAWDLCEEVSLHNMARKEAADYLVEVATSGRLSPSDALLMYCTRMLMHQTALVDFAKEKLNCANWDQTMAQIDKDYLGSDICKVIDWLNAHEDQYSILKSLRA